MDFWKNKNVLVTGANGFIGSWVTEALVKNKANVTWQPSYSLDEGLKKTIEWYKLNLNKIEK